MPGPDPHPPARGRDSAPAASFDLLADEEALADLGSWRVDVRTLEGTFSDGVYRILGLEPQERALDLLTLRAHLHPQDRAGADAALAATTGHADGLPATAVDTSARVIRPDGSVRHVRLRARVQRDGRGRPQFLAGVLRDVTLQQELSRRLATRAAVSRALQDWKEFDRGVIGLLRRAGGALDLQLGEFWSWSADTERIVCRAFWGAPGIDAQEFELATRRLSRTPHAGSLGHVWATREPLVVPDLYDALDPRRAPQAARLGLASALAFPAVGPDETLAVIAFYGADRIEPSDGLTETLAGIGHEVGHFLSGRLGELQPPGLSRREVEVLQHAADGHTGPEIAARLMIGSSTVKTHFEHIYAKTGVGDRAAAVAYALRLGLIV